MSAVRTHRRLDPGLCGRVVALASGHAEVELATGAAMSADERGLVHGGFLFGVADHAAMLAVNEPTVVLGAATVKFLRPVREGEAVRARAVVERIEGRKRIVAVTVRRGEDIVLEGTFTCLVPDRHVLD